ncbi:hypothetical protein [Pseudonocardia nigra]|uniref:hypothetical protein n=1 Tax=Pseudonocardia nigra TaxID=1921578 RepID=UPI001C5EEB8B|nr:hypothetical protein [Pseudonocardia nigra]
MAAKASASTGIRRRIGDTVDAERRTGRHARTGGVTELEIVVDAHERYPYKFANQHVRTQRRGLRCGDYAVTLGEQTVAAVEP